MDNKIAVQRLFRGILLRAPSSSEEKLFTKFFDDRSLSYDQLAVLGWQSEEFMKKVAPIALLDYALSGGNIDGQRIIGWYNSPAGAPLAPTGSDRVLNAIDVMLSAYGLASDRNPTSLASALTGTASLLGITLPPQNAILLANYVINGGGDLPSLLQSAATQVINDQPQMMYYVGAGLLESILNEQPAVPFSGPPMFDAQTIINAYLAPRLHTYGGSTVYEVYENLTSNDGTVSPITLDLTGADWRGRAGDTVSMTATLPAGLTAKAVIVSTPSAPQTIQINFSGKARAHDTSASTTITLKFSDINFNGAKAVDIEPMVKGVLTLDLLFSNNYPWLNYSSGSGSADVLEVFGSQKTAVVNLATQTGQIGTFSLDSTLSSNPITTVDARGISGTAVSLTGSSSTDTLYANHLGSTIRGGAGDDTLFGGTKGAIDTFIFEAVASPGTFFIPGNGMDTIYNFQVGATGDILDFREFLGVPTFVPTAIAASAFPATAWANGNILIVTESGNSLNTPANIAALFTGAATPTAPAELVIITAGVPPSGSPGVAMVWFISNRSAAGSITSIESVEVTKVAELIGVNNIALLSFQADNFLV
jgi:hypothetical protein